MLNETNEFAPFPPFARGGRFQSVGVSEMNVAGNPVYDFVITHPDGTTIDGVRAPDPGRALINGSIDFESFNAFKIPSLWGVSRTAPYFHDNSAKTLDEVAQQYARFFGVLGLTLTEQDQKDTGGVYEVDAIGTNRAGTKAGSGPVPSDGPFQLRVRHENHRL